MTEPPVGAENLCHQVIFVEDAASAVMDRVYMHVTRQMRERLCEVLEELWQDALAERCKVDPHSHVPLLDHELRVLDTGH
jgi:hypothetical protein